MNACGHITMRVSPSRQGAFGKSNTWQATFSR